MASDFLHTSCHHTSQQCDAILVTFFLSLDQVRETRVTAITGFDNVTLSLDLTNAAGLSTTEPYEPDTATIQSVQTLSEHWNDGDAAIYPSGCPDDSWYEIEGSCYKVKAMSN